MNKKLVIALCLGVFSHPSFSQLSLQSGAGVLIEDGATVTIEGNLDLHSNSNTFSSLVVHGSVDVLGTSKYHRFVNSQDNRKDLVSAPLANQLWNTFLSNDSDYNANNLYTDGVSTPNTSYLFGPFEKGSTDDYIVYNHADVETLEPGMGYRAATNTPEAVATGVPLIFTGSVLEADVSVNIYNDLNGAYREWNLVGNPYPAYLDVESFFNHEISPGVTNLDVLESNSAAIYGYDADDTDLTGTFWTITNLMEGPEYLAPGQGFFVTSEDAAATIQFTRDMLVIATSDDFIDRSSESHQYIKLEASDNNNRFSTTIYFDDNTSPGLDPGYDATLFGGLAPDFALYSQLVEDNNGLPMAIQCFNDTLLNEVVVPLGLNANQGTNITFQLIASNLNATTEVYLEDTLLNIYTLLNDSHYTFNTSTNLSGTGRFYLRFAESTLGMPETALDGISIYSLHDQKAVMIQGELDAKTTATIMDIQGRSVMSDPLEGHVASQIIDVSNLSTGVYIVQIDHNNIQKIQKIIIK